MHQKAAWDSMSGEYLHQEIMLTGQLVALRHLGARLDQRRNCSMIWALCFFSQTWHHRQASGRACAGRAPPRNSISPASSSSLTLRQHGETGEADAVCELLVADTGVLLQFGEDLALDSIKLHGHPSVEEPQ